MKSLLSLLFILISFSAHSYPISDHYDGKNFFNPWGNDLKSFWEVMKWKMTSESTPWPQHVPIKNYPLRPLTSSEKVNVTFINHATFLLQFPGVNVLTDPIFSQRASPFTFAGPERVKLPGIALDQLPHIDVVVVSHNHYDHMDLEALKMIDAKFHPLFLVPLGDERHLSKVGIQNIKAMDWWEEVRVKDLRLIFAPAQHWSARQLWDKNECLWGSFMMDSGAVKVYHAGDTGYGPHFLDIKSRLGSPDIALLPIGAYKPRWFMKFHHMDPEDAVKAHFDLSSALSIAMHFGTFQMADDGLFEPTDELSTAKKKANLTDKTFLTLEEGQALSF